MMSKGATYRELYLACRARLQRAGVEDPGTDAAQLCRHFFSLDRAGLAVHGEETCPEGLREKFLQAQEERAGRRPLQYILGQWDFMGLPLKVGEGVLAPREDTAALVEAVAARLPRRKGLYGVDLCAGTGAVALGLCSLCPGVRIDCIELSEKALFFLRENLASYPQYPIQARQGDICSPQDAQAIGPLDVLVSNPPYIRSAVLPTLQPEVRREPSMALDGGGDGLGFYRAIAALWLPKLKPGGLVGVEIGEEQGEAVAGLFRQAGLTGIAVHQDWAGLDRAVTATAQV